MVEILVRDHLYDLSQLCTEEPTPLQIAAASGSTSVVDFILTRVTGLKFKSRRVNPLHLAVDNGHISIARSLLAFNPMLLVMPDHNGNTPLHHACAHGHLPVVSYLCNEAKHPLLVRNKQGETPLHMATKHGHLDLVRYLIDDKLYDPTTKDSMIGCTPLHLAAKNGYLDIIQYLAGDKGCNFECKTSHQKKGKAKHVVSGRTPLHYASYGGHCDVVMYLIEEQLCNPCCTDDHGFTPLHLACQEGHSEVVRYFLSLKDIELHQMVNDDGLTPIHAASLSGNLEIMKLLIDQNEGDPSIIDSEGRTALHYSSRKGHTDVVQYLVQDSRVVANCSNQSNVTPLHLAAQYGHLDTVKYLTSEALANPGAAEENGYTPLHLAANKGHLAVVEFLVGERHSSCMLRDKAGRTPLHHACQSGHLNMVQYLTSQVDCDASCQEKNLKASPLHLAASFGHLDIVRYLVEEKNCSPTCTDKFNSTPIHRAAASGHCDVMTYFKSKQCNLALKNKFGNTPLHLACQKGQVPMVEMLLSFSKDNMTTRNQVGRMPLDLTDSVEILSIFLRNGVDPSKGSIASKFPYLKCWDPLSLTVKIFVLGDLDTGKSTLAKALQGGGFFQEWVTGKFQRVTPPDSETSGIIPITFSSKHFGRVVLYDFAGHPCYHASHSVIMDMVTRGSSPIFLITVDLRKPPELIEKSVAYWCTLILLISSDTEFTPHMVLVGTHEDELSKDGMRHKPAVLERISLASNNGTGIKFNNWITVDCRKPNSASINKLRQLISQRCDILYTNSHLDHKSCLLRSFMLHKFQGTSVVEFHELLEYLSHANIPDIKTKDDLYQACQSLHSCGYILFLESKDSVESSWIINNQEAILSMVHGFHRLVEIPNPLGLVTPTQLHIGLGAIGFNITLATRYLLRMEFCIKLADRRVLHSISGFDPPHPLEDHLFFPHLVRSSAPPDLWDGGETYDQHFGWYVSCLDEHQMLGPRFLQLLILRLASQFCFNTDPNSPFGARRSSCVIWQRGLSWCDSRGIEGLVELRKDSKAMLFLARTKTNNQRHGSSLDFFHFRSAVSRTVRQVKRETCARIAVNECIIHPESLVQSLPDFNSRTELNLPMVKLSDVFAALMSPDSDSVAWEQTLLDSETVEIVSNTHTTIQELLTFDPFLGLPHSVLTKLFSEEEKDVPITDSDLDSISESLSENHWELKHLLIVLSLPYSDSRSSGHCANCDAGSFRAVLNRWLARSRDNNERRTYFELHSMLSQYSVFNSDQNYEHNINDTV